MLVQFILLLSTLYTGYPLTLNFRKTRFGGNKRTPWVLPERIRFQIYTVGENIIAAIKIRNNIFYPFLYCSPFSYRSSNYAIAKVVTHNLFASILMSFVDWLMASFLYRFPYSYRYFTLLKALAKSSIIYSLSPLRARKNDNYCYRDSC